MTQGIGNYQNIPYQQGYGAPVQNSMPQYAVPSGAQMPYQTAPAPSYQPQQSYTGYVPYGQYMPYIMPNFAPPVLYVEPPRIQMQSPEQNGVQQGYNAAGMNIQPQIQQAPQMQAVPQNTLPQSQNPQGMINSAPNNAPLNLISTPDTNAQSAMNAQMPAPNLQGGQMQQMQQSAMEKIPNQEQNLPQGMNIGVVEGPQSYSKTPIMDSLNRQAVSTERVTVPKTGGKTSKLTLGKVSSFCMSASIGIMLATLAAKIIKTFRHK